MNTHLVGIFGVPFGRWEQRAVILLPEQPVLPFPMGWDKGLRWLPHYGGWFIWKEFKGASKSTNLLIALMFILFILGLALIITSGGN